MSRDPLDPPRTLKILERLCREAKGMDDDVFEEKLAAFLAACGGGIDAE